MDITPASIRDASFPLAPTGCNPVQVEETLAKIADCLGKGEVIPAQLFEVEFDTVSAGFDAGGVAAFFSSLKESAISSTAASTPVAAEASPAPEPPEAPAAEPDHVSSLDAGAGNGVSPDPVGTDVEPSPGSDTNRNDRGGDRIALVPPRPSAQTTMAVTSGLPGAVERTKLAVSELESFVMQQMEEAKTALRLHIDQTQSDCLNTLDTARTVSDQALDTARQRAEAMLDVATRTTNQLRDRFESELASMRSAFEEDLARRYAAVRHELEALVEEAKDLTEEAHEQLAQVHDDVRPSLEDARSILTNPTSRMAA